MTEIINLDEVVAAIRNASDRIAKGVKVCNDRLVVFLDADHARDVAYAQAFLDHKGPQTEKKHGAELAIVEVRKARDTAYAAYKYAESQAEALEAELRAWQSVNKSITAMYSAVGVSER